MRACWHCGGAHTDSASRQEFTPRKVASGLKLPSFTISLAVPWTLKPRQSTSALCRSRSHPGPTAEKAERRPALRTSVQHRLSMRRSSAGTARTRRSSFPGNHGDNETTHVAFYTGAKRPAPHEAQSILHPPAGKRQRY